jgi:hypothetical protein
MVLITESGPAAHGCGEAVVRGGGRVGSHSSHTHVRWILQAAAGCRCCPAGTWPRSPGRSAVGGIKPLLVHWVVHPELVDGLRQRLIRYG